MLGNINELINDVTPPLRAQADLDHRVRLPDEPARPRSSASRYAKQARTCKQAYAIARKNPRIDMMLWFLLKDEKRLGGWQSGLLTAAGKKKPSFNAFRALPR